MAANTALPSQTVSALPFFLPYVVPLITVCVHYADNAFLALIPPMFVWIIVPLFDTLFHHRVTRKINNIEQQVDDRVHKINTRMLTSREKRQLSCRVIFRLAIYLWAPTQISLLLWALHRVTNASIGLVRLIGLLMSLSLTAAEGMNCAHELLHRRNRAERLLGYGLLVAVWYGHFAIEHSRGHHVRVATRADPATLRYGESFYHFLPRTVVGGFRSAWRLEALRLLDSGYSETAAWWGLGNAVVACNVAQCILTMVVGLRFGMIGVGIVCAQALAAVTLLEQVNAIEHYGLERRRGSDGRYERVGVRHSWDAPMAVSGYLMFKLQLHAEHHLDASLRYQALEETEGSPRLPSGYLTLAPLLLVPWAWRAVMDPVLKAHWARWDQLDRMARR